MDVRVCRDCGEEYRLDAPVQSCSDCGGPLESREHPNPIAAEDPDEDWDGAAAELLRLHVGGSRHEIAPLVERLAAAGIRFWVRARVNAFEVHVNPDDYERAMSERRAALQLDGGVDIESSFDAATGYAQCPACGARLEPSHGDCPECGLTLRSEEDEDHGSHSCERCGKSHDSGGCRSAV
jgi:hypothetical protein